MRSVKLAGLSFLALLHVGIMITMVEAIYDRAHFYYYGNSGYAAEAVYQIPGTHKEIVLERRAAHLFLAEYDRELVFLIGDREIARRTAAADSGGYSRMKVFQISPSSYFLCGEMSYDAHVLDAWGRSIRDAGDEEKLLNATYVGVFDKDEKKSWRFLSANERAEDKDKIDDSGCSRHLSI